jgi:rfaE bifunctional protein nucleotidyltransferase chain/domain
MGNDVFGPGSNFERRFVPDYDELVARVESCRRLDMKVVLTSGSFDIKHVGHDRYLERGKQLAGTHGILVVGVDSDEKVSSRKGPNRPVVPEAERVEGLCHLRHVDLVTLKPKDAPKWELIRRVKPDVLLITEETYDTPESLQKLADFLAEFGGRYERIPPQAETSTTAKLRRLMLDLKNKFKVRLEEMITWVDEI